MLTVLVFSLLPKSGDSFKEQTEKKNKLNSVIWKEKLIPEILELKAIYIERRKEDEFKLITKDKYKDYISYPKKKKKKKRTRRSIWQENNLDFYLQENNLIQFSIQIFLLLRDVVAVLLRKHFFFLNSWHCHTKFADIVLLKCCYSSNSFQSFLFRGI